METPLISKRIFNRFRKHFPVARGIARVDDRLLISGIIFVIMYGLPWRQMPEFYGKWTTAYSRFRRWSEKGIFRKAFSYRCDKQGKSNVGMIDSTFIKVARTAASLKADGEPREIGRSHGGLTTKIHFICNDKGKAIDFYLTPGHVHDAKAADSILRRNFFRLKTLLADKAYDCDRIRNLAKIWRCETCIPPKSNRINPVPYDKVLYKKRKLIEILFGRLKDWRGIATRYCRCANTFDSFVCIALTVLFG